MKARVVNAELKALDKARASYRRTYTRLVHQNEQARTQAEADAIIARLAAAQQKLAAAQAAADATATWIEVR